jgi:hypothetical protein
MLGWQGRIFVYLRHQQEALTAKSFKGIVNLTNLRTIFGNFRGSNTASRA